MKGINYGHHLITANFIKDGNLDIRKYKSVVKQEMIEIYNQGFDSIRLDLPQWNGAPWSSPALLRRRMSVEIALSLPFKNVLWGVVHTRPKVTAANFIESRSFVLQTLLPWAQSLGDKRLVMSIGNEEEPHVDGTTMTASAMRTGLLDLAYEANQIYTVGPIGYEASIDSVYGVGNVWTDNNTGSLDLFGVNVYKGVLADYAGFRVSVKNIHERFGGKLYCGEFNVGNGFDDMAPYGKRYGEEMYSKVNLARRDILNAYNTPWYFFAYASNNIETFQPNAFGLRRPDGTFHDLWYLL